MFNPIRFLISHKTVSDAIAAEAVALDPISAREDFTLYDVDQMTVRQILDVLRRDTIEFTEQHNLTWAVTDFTVHSVPVRVKLTENQDVWYYVNGELALSQKEAIELIKTESVQF